MIDTAPDCTKCIKKDSCENAQPGRFCTAFASEQPEERPDPNKAWRSGEDFDY